MPKAAWGTVVGVPFSEAQWSLGCLPVRHGGAGIIDPVQVHPQAAVSSFLTAASGTGVQLTRVPADLFDALNCLRRVVPGVADPLIAMWSVGSLGDILKHAQIEIWADQMAWTEAVDRAVVLSFDAEASTRIIVQR